MLGLKLMGFTAALVWLILTDCNDEDKMLLLSIIHGVSQDFD